MAWAERPVVAVTLRRVAALEVSFTAAVRGLSCDRHEYATATLGSYINADNTKVASDAGKGSVTSDTNVKRLEKIDRGSIDSTLETYR